MFLEELGWYIGMAATTIYNEKMLKKLSFEKYYITSFVHALTVFNLFETYLLFFLKFLQKAGMREL